MQCVLHGPEPIQALLHNEPLLPFSSSIFISFLQLTGNEDEVGELKEKVFFSAALLLSVYLQKKSRQMQHDMVAY